MNDIPRHHQVVVWLSSAGLTLTASCALFVPSTRTTLYGVVVDEDERPLEGVQVKVDGHKSSFNYWRMPVFETVVCTDSNGAWRFTARNAYEVFAGIVNDRKYATAWARPSDLGPFKSSIGAPSNPLKLYARRRQTADVLLHRDVQGMDFPHRKTPAWFEVDLVQNLARRSDGYFRFGSRWGDSNYADFRVERVVVNTQVIGIAFCAVNPGDGVILSTNELFVAPEGGYEQRVVLTREEWMRRRDAHPSSPLVVTYLLYSRSRPKPVYARSECEVHLWHDEARIEFGWPVVNPYGERNLEDAEWASDNTRIILEREAQRLIPQGLYPAKRDVNIGTTDSAKSKTK